MGVRWGMLLLGLGILSACTVVPTGPSVLVLPAVVAYLGLADNSRGPLLSRLRGLSPPVVRSRNRLPAPYAALLSCFRPTDPAC